MFSRRHTSDSRKRNAKQSERVTRFISCSLGFSPNIIAHAFWLVSWQTERGTCSARVAAGIELKIGLGTKSRPENFLFSYM